MPARIRPCSTNCVEKASAGGGWMGARAGRQCQAATRPAATSNKASISSRPVTIFFIKRQFHSKQAGRARLSPMRGLTVACRHQGHVYRLRPVYEPSGHPLEHVDAPRIPVSLVNHGLVLELQSQLLWASLVVVPIDLEAQGEVGYLG